MNERTSIENLARIAVAQIICQEDIDDGATVAITPGNMVVDISLWYRDDQEPEEFSFKRDDWHNAVSAALSAI